MRLPSLSCRSEDRDGISARPPAVETLSSNISLTFVSDSRHPCRVDAFCELIPSRLKLDKHDDLSLERKQKEG